MGNNFKFLSENFINGSSTLAASSETAIVGNLIDRDPSVVWSSSGEGTDGTASTITWTPPAAITIDRLFLQNHNFKNYTAYYNGTASNAFTPAVSVSNGSGSHSYHEFGTVSITSITIKPTATLVANQEKTLGQLFVGTQQFEAAANPDEYSPIEKKKGPDLELADGGFKSIWIAQKYNASLNFQYVLPAEVSNFKSLYDQHTDFYFMPTPADGTAWDGDAWNVNWIGDYDALKLTNGIGKTTGYDLNMELREVAGA